MPVVYSRIREIMEDKGLKPASLARVLDEKLQRVQDILSGKQRVPEDVLIKIVEIFNVNGTWLLTGQGEKYCSLSKSKNLDISIIIEWLKGEWETANDKERNWLEIQFGRCFPEFKEWLDRQK